MSQFFKTAAKIAFGDSVVDLVIKGAESASNAMADASTNIVQLREEAVKQEIKMEFSKLQARIAQELAIAKRIENATEVEIEEYYDNGGKGSAGLNVNAETQTGSFGLSAENRRVTKRIYRFKGNFDSNSEEIYEQELSAQKS